MAPAMTVALIAALAAAAGGGNVDESLRRIGRSTVVAVGSSEVTGGTVGVSGTAIDTGADTALDAVDVAQMAEMAEVPAWRDLWYGSLEALHILREPSINNTQEDVLVQLGAVAFLHCPVRNLGERGVSWVRRRDWHIISSGVLMYTNDERFQVLHSEGSDDWILQIKYVQKRDNGTYECQVSTGSGTLSRLVHLHIAVPEAFILGADEHHVDAGSSINLVCIIEKSPVPPQYVFWYHNARMINYDAARGVTVTTEPGPKTQSTLAIRAAAAQHSGNYTCCAANTEPAHIYVFVSEGSDKMAATLSRNSDASQRPRALPAPLLLAALAALRRRGDSWTLF
ncbi:protein amalgam [Aphomia sociella]